MLYNEIDLASNVNFDTIMSENISTKMARLKRLVNYTIG